MSKLSSKKLNSYSLLLKDVKKMKPKQPPKVDPKKQPGTSSKIKKEVIEDPDQPDKALGDYYCKICDAHMNAQDIWESHVTGKRHLKNVESGEADSKYEDLPDAESSLMDELKNITEPVVGLNYIHEIRRKEPIPTIYNCFLCHANLSTVPLVTEHILSLKHRLNFVKENAPEQYDLITSTNLKKGLLEPLVNEAVGKLEEAVGRGTIKVKQEKQKKPVITYSARKSFNLKKVNTEEILDQDRSYKNSRSDANVGFWKSLNEGKKRRSRSTESEDDYTRRNSRSRSRSRSPMDRWSFSEKKSYEGHGSFSNRDVPSQYDNLNYTTTSEEYAKNSLNSDHLKSSKQFSPQDLPYVAQSRKLKVQEIKYIISKMPMIDRLELLLLTRNALPELSDCTDMLFLMKINSTCRNKIKEAKNSDSYFEIIEQSKAYLEYLRKLESSAEQQKRNVPSKSSAVSNTNDTSESNTAYFPSETQAYQMHPGNFQSSSGHSF